MEDWFSFDDVPWSRLTDASGRRWKPREILAMSCEDFTARFDHFGRDAIAVYGMVAAEAKRDEASRLPPAERTRFARLDRIDRNVRREAAEFAYLVDPWDFEGTRGLGVFLFFHAEGEDRLRRAVLNWGSDVAGGRARYRRAMAALRIKVSAGVRHRLNPKAILSPDPKVARSKASRLRYWLDEMDALAPELHSFVLAQLAQTIEASARLLLPPESYR